MAEKVVKKPTVIGRVRKGSKNTQKPQENK